MAKGSHMDKINTLEQLISLRGKRALITGAAGGIGQAIARRYAEAGAALELVDIDAMLLARTAEELTTRGAEVYTHVIDLAHKEQIDALWDSLAGREPDILVNNAGIYPFREFADADEGFVRRVMEINLFSVSWMCQQMICRRHKRGGVIINVGSIEAVQPFKEDLAHYSVSKAGVTALTRALAKEYARHGFRVNAILPGGIMTPGTKAAARQVLHLKFDLLKTGFDFSQRLPIGRVGQPDEVARMALVLASDLASYVHGAAIPIDGGFLAA